MKQNFGGSNVKWGKVGLFAAGVLFGTAGIKILSSKDAKKVYTSCTAAALRAKDCIVEKTTTLQENLGDIYESAKQINEERAAAEEVYEDAATEEVFEDTAEDELKEAEQELAE